MKKAQRLMGRFRTRSPLVFAFPVISFLVCSASIAKADSQASAKQAVTSVQKSVAFHRCISMDEPIPNWSGKMHPKSSLKWSVLGSQGDLVLYHARCTWPSDEMENSNYMVATEVVYEGTRDGKDLKPLYSDQEDETYEYLSPLVFHRVGKDMVVEIERCMNGTGGCGQEFFFWRPGELHPIKATIRKEINAWLPPRYTTMKAPHINIEALSGKSGAWLKNTGGNWDANCCPSQTVKFTLRLVDSELRIKHMTLVPGVDGHRVP